MRLESPLRPLRIAVAGKGGVGKTTLTSLLASHFLAQGRGVLAIDADPSPCLGPALGFTADELAEVVPLSAMEGVLDERSGGRTGVFRMNPTVADLPDKLTVAKGALRLLLLGSVEHGGGGCFCPASSVLRELVRHLMLKEGEVVLLDLYAGVEHLGRATADSVDAMLVVAGPNPRSIATAHQVRRMAQEVGIERLLLVGNGIRGAEDAAYLMEGAGDFEIAGMIRLSAKAGPAERAGRALYGVDRRAAMDVDVVAAAVERSLTS
ncbi:MAG: AAA family ATPase [Actinomycetota bacterium]|nr:AAA family ATPase [Actinomycetota bacterium]